MFYEVTTKLEAFEYSVVGIETDGQGRILYCSHWSARNRLESEGLIQIDMLPDGHNSEEWHRSSNRWSLTQTDPRRYAELQGSNRT